MFRRVAIQYLQMIRRAQVVRILNRNPRCPRLLDAKIAGGGWAAIFLIEIPYAITVNAQGLSCVVPRAIVNDDKLKILECLLQDAVDGLGQKLRPIVSTNDNRDFRCAAHLTEAAIRFYEYPESSRRGFCP